MAREHQEKGRISRRRFLGIGAAFGAALVGLGSVEIKPAVAQEQVAAPAAEAVTTVGTTPVTPDRRGVITDPKIAEFIKNADALVNRFGHANFDQTKASKNI